MRLTTTYRIHLRGDWFCSKQLGHGRNCPWGHTSMRLLPVVGKVNDNHSDEIYLRFISCGRGTRFQLQRNDGEQKKPSHPRHRYCRTQLFPLFLPIDLCYGYCGEIFGRIEDAAYPAASRWDLYGVSHT